MCLKNVANIRRLIIRSALRGDVRFSQPLPATHTRPYRTARVASRCGRTGCLTCPIIEERDCIISAAAYERLPIATGMTCSSSHLIYVIRCVVCGMQYVGESCGLTTTGRNFVVLLGHLIGTVFIATSTCMVGLALCV